VGEQPPILEGKPASDYWNTVKLNKPVEEKKEEVARGA
jgi:glycyl-tRNA synthetase alpha chain